MAPRVRLLPTSAVSPTPAHTTAAAHVWMEAVIQFQHRQIPGRAQKLPAQMPAGKQTLLQVMHALVDVQPLLLRLRQILLNARRHPALMSAVKPTQIMAMLVQADAPQQHLLSLTILRHVSELRRQMPAETPIPQAVMNALEPEPAV